MVDVMSDWEGRVTELEIQLALQEDLLQSLNDTVVQLRQALDLQQAQLRLLYSRMQDKDAAAPSAGGHEVPPHY